MIDIYSKATYPGNVLSNFYNNSFNYNAAIRCRSMESFLQGIKISNPVYQTDVFLMEARQAKAIGQSINWQSNHILYIQGKPISRFDDKYQELLDNAYTSMFYESSRFREALLSTQGEILTHKIGLTNMKKTVLTRYEFITRLYRLRNIIQREGIIHGK